MPGHCEAIHFRPKSLDGRTFAVVSPRCRTVGPLPGDAGAIESVPRWCGSGTSGYLVGDLENLPKWVTHHGSSVSIGAFSRSRASDASSQRPVG